MPPRAHLVADYVRRLKAKGAVGVAEGRRPAHPGPEDCSGPGSSQLKSSGRDEEHQVFAQQVCMASITYSLADQNLIVGRVAVTTDAA